MNRQTVRIGVALVAMFYAVIGGLWAINYFPLHKFYSQQEIEEQYVEQFGYKKWWDSEEYKKSNDYITLYAITHPDIFVTERKIGLYQSVLLWGTVALGVGTSVLFLTRGKRAR